ncbi:DUF47 domain-containing protein [Miltoncostaea oceani]|uniref:DUF47 domain-containing protein n=1 Tax=Miltoncostaea oceani TaxID=2843216 RepID=UPI001C3CDD6A|nr:DUF47 family protein [Miltoncostaea oceani]
MIARIARSARALGDRVAPRVPDFHGMLIDQCAVGVDALDALVVFARDGDPEAGARVREREKEGDRRRAITLETLARAFATPIDRGAIHLAATSIDDVLNYAKTTVREMEILGVPPDRWTAELAEHLQAGGVALLDGFTRLRDDPAGAHAAALAVHKSERNAEKAYRAAVADALAPGPIAEIRVFDRESVEASLAVILLALRRREVYRHLSNGADRLDTAGRALLDIVLADV